MIAELLAHGGEEPQKGHRRIGHDTEGNLKHGRSGSSVDEDVPSPLGLSEVKEQSHADQGVAEKAGHHGRPHQGLQLLDVETCTIPLRG